MAKNIFYEARAEAILGQAAVARVVLNRVNHGFAETPCKVIYQKTTINENVICQFSWVCEGKGEPNKSSAQYKQAEVIAYQVMMGKYKDVVPKTTLFFHSIHVDPSWPYKKVAKIGNHIFYSKQRVKKTDGK
jgi:spore germination cell wall hydrolase CwlJ-like protein